MEVDGDVSWSERHLERVRQGTQPHLEIELDGSEEAEGHTWYTEGNRRRFSLWGVHCKREAVRPVFSFLLHFVKFNIFYE